MPSWTRSPGIPIPATASRKKRLAAPAQLPSSGSGLAKQPPERTLSCAGTCDAVAKASATGAAISPPSPDGRPNPPGRSSPLSAGDGNMLLRLRDLGICETQIMSQLPLFAMASSENRQVGCISALPGGCRRVAVAAAELPARACAGTKGRVYSRNRGSYLMVTLPGLETGAVREEPPGVHPGGFLRSRCGLISRCRTGPPWRPRGTPRTRRAPRRGRRRPGACCPGQRSRQEGWLQSRRSRHSANSYLLCARWLETDRSLFLLQLFRKLPEEDRGVGGL